MLKIGLILLALIAGLVGTTTHYAFANYMCGPAMGPAPDTGGGGGGGSTGSSTSPGSVGPSTPTTGPSDSGSANAGSSGGRGTDRPLIDQEWWSNGWQQDHPDWTVADWHRHHNMASYDNPAPLMEGHHHSWTNPHVHRWGHWKPWESSGVSPDQIEGNIVHHKPMGPFDLFGGSPKPDSQ